jgi:hypothetical protein
LEYAVILPDNGKKVPLSETTFRGLKVSAYHYRKLFLAGLFTRNQAKVKGDYRAE